MNNLATLKLFHICFRVTSVIFFVLTFSFSIDNNSNLWIMWRDETAVALMLTAAAALMALGWLLTARRIRQRTPETTDSSFISDRKSIEKITAPYNIWGTMERSVRMHMALAVFLTFSIIGPISLLMRGTPTVFPLTTVLLMTISSGMMAASFILFGHKLPLLILSFGICFVANMSADSLTRWIENKSATRQAPNQSESINLSAKQVEAMTDQRSLIGSGSILLLVAGYIMWVLVLNKEGNKRVRYQTEVHIARDIQQTLLPSEVFKNSWCEAFGITIPAEEVGGDYFDTIQISDNQVAVVVADVAGHGIGAGILSAMTKSALRSQVLHDSAPAAVLHNLNETIHQVTEKKMFVTLAYVLLDWNTRTAHIATAGHPPIFHKNGGDGTLQEVRTQSLGLGMQKQGVFAEVRVPLAHGDSLLLYTDGVTEAANQNNEQFGSERLTTILSTSNSLSTSELSRHVMASVNAFCEKKELADDATVVCISISTPWK